MKPLKKIALVGCPNSGKSSLFNALTGLNQKVGNFPGVTVDRKVGKMKTENEDFSLIDLPGCYSLYSRSEDERITRDVLLNPENPSFPDLVIVVADFGNLRRSLSLAGQILDLKLPTLLVLNMADLIEPEHANNIQTRLKKKLPCSIVNTSVLNNKGIETLIKEIPIALKTKPNPELFFSIPPTFEEQLKNQKPYPNRYAAWLTWLISNKENEALIGNELAVRFDLAGDWIEEEPEPLSSNFSQKIDQVLLHPFWGYFIFLAVLLLVFQAIFAWAAIPMEGIDYLFSSVGEGLKKWLPYGFLTGLLIDGLWAGIGGILVFIPQIAFLFLFIAVLEETGYMSRVVFLMDRIVRPFGFSGRAVIPLIGGMACAVPSIMMARNIPDKRERLITILVTPLMSCSARIPVFTLIIALIIPAQSIAGFLNLQGLVLLGLYLLGFFAALGVAWILKRFISGESNSLFLTELPIYRLPRVRNVALTIFNKCKTFVVETGKIILVISSLLWLLSTTGPTGEIKRVEADFAAKKSEQNLSQIELEALSMKEASAKLQVSWAGQLGSFIEPAIRPLGFDWKIGISLITSFAAREVFVGTMATLYATEAGDESYASLRKQMQAETFSDNQKPVYSFATGMALLIFYAFAMQCMSTIAVVKRETASWYWALFLTTYLTVLAWVSAFITFQVLSAWS